jgi:AraC-like DNA-binding protein
MINIAPALCSLVCVLFVVMLMRDFGNSSERALRLLAIVLFLAAGVLWFFVSSRFLHGAVWGVAVGAVAGVAVSLGQVWLTHRLILRRHLRSKKFRIFTTRSSPSAPPAGGELSLRSLEEYFKLKRPYLDPGFRLTVLADALGVNRAELSSFINRTLGINFKRYLNRWRLAEFERLMSLPSNEFKNPYKVAAMAGFSDSRHFHRVVELEKATEPLTEHLSAT